MTSITVREKDPDVQITYDIDWSSYLAEIANPQSMARGVYYQSGDVRRAEIDTGLDYQCTTAGRTAFRRPATGFPASAGSTVQDGSVVWTAQAPGAPIEVQTAVWTVPDGITKVSQTEDANRTYITLSGGTDGVDYELVCEMTPTSGAARDQTIIVPVRAQ